ncbi:MAG: CPBP family intramembrane metalloprotease [Bacteroidia bacterium]|nr:CPBP family intramembrane metalloprotease [Bacteroidia bacterium]MBT8278864.1 CPBP family intramembrane metalloprotease [Bacteroidia bacterium]NND25930.1 CPBP family intramembrane metalloprotease [Flavobacteriaceae bacterium]NNK60769.1 CPBP family intramembrane metalloprotease [Flavobacteriaceae bacterium]NNL33540.1 CPBP family intramembrane metalloprotease [Flavobacteriaceae bacterium]
MNYIQQAYKGKTELWMFILTAFLISGIFILNFILYLFTSEEDMEAAYAMMNEIPANINLIINLIPFAVLLVLLFVFVKFVHQRSLLSLTTARSKIDWSRIAFSFFLIVFLTVGSFAFSYYSDSSQIELQFDPLKFAILFIISIILFPFQIGLEEYLFRGYLMQHLGIIVKNKWFPLLFTSVLFGLAHSANPEVAEMGYITMIFYIGTGLLLGIMTLMDDGLELALGFHFGNNLIAALLITADWSALQTDAIFRYTAEEATSNALTDIVIPVLIFYPIILFVFSKKYKWSGWRSKLFGSVEKPRAEDYKILESE